MITFDSASSSHAGQVRDVNQDRALVVENLVAVADGMGGHAGGELAATIAVDELGQVEGPFDHDQLVEVVAAANRRIYAEAEVPELRGMGTTLVAAVVDATAETVTVVNVGDSRAYLLRDDELHQVTNDHSLVEDLVRQGRLTPDDAKIHPQRNIITRVLGIGETVDIDSFLIEVEPGDRFVLCSDGLVNEVDDDGIAATLARFVSSADAADELVALALARGGRDNVTVVVLDVHDNDGSAVGHAAESDREDQDDTMAHDTVGQDGIAFELDDPVISPQKKRRPPFRSLMFAIAVLAVAAVGFVGTAWYARSAWYADEVDGEIVIFRGRPDGILWFQPSEVEATGVRVEALDPASQEVLSTRPEWDSLADAREFVTNLESNSAAAVGG